MKRASQQIARDAARMREADCEGIAHQVRNFAQQADKERGRENGKGLDHDEGLDR